MKSIPLATRCFIVATLAANFVLALGFSATAQQQVNSDEATPVATDVIKLKTEPCELTRPKAKMDSIVAVMSQKPDNMVRRCSIKVQGTEVAIYLPKEKNHSVENTDEDNTAFGNTSTYISIDQNGDGELQPSEAVPTNLPIRILDTMFEVVEIAEDSSSISLRKTGGPLHGVVLDRACPEFSFQTVDGKVVSDKSILGKVTILDIWAVT